MASVRFADLQSRPTEFLDFTSLTLDEFRQLVPPFEAAFQAHMAVWRLDGKPRTARRFNVYQNCPFPTPEERLLFILAYMKAYALQVVQGRLFGMGQSKAHQWIHVLLPVLLAACAPSAMPLPVPCAPSPSDSVSWRWTPPPGARRWRRRQYPSSLHQPPRQRPPFCP